MKMQKSNCKNFKKIIIISLFLFLFLLSVVCNVILFIDKNDSIYKNDENIVFFGDSITQGYNIGDFFSRIKFVNSGKNGDKTENLIKRLRGDVYKYNPSDVVLLIGINDAIHGIDKDDIISNIDTIIKEIKLNRSQTKIYVESIYPINEKKVKDSSSESLKKVVNSKIKDINKDLKIVCQKNNVQYIHVYDSLTDKDGNLKERYTTDGLHLTNLGYLKVSSVLKEYIYK